MKLELIDFFAFLLSVVFISTFAYVIIEHYGLRAVLSSLATSSAILGLYLVIHFIIKKLFKKGEVK